MNAVRRTSTESESPRQISNLSICHLANNTLPSQNELSSLEPRTMQFVQNPDVNLNWESNECDLSH